MSPNDTDFTLLKAAIDLTGSLDLKDGLQKFVNQACAFTSSPHATMSVLDTWGATTLQLEHHDSLPGPTVPHSLTTAIPVTAPLLVNSPSDAPDLELPDSTPPFLGISVLVREQVYGRLYLTGKPGGYTSDDAAVVTALAPAAGIVVENAHLYADSKRTARWISASQSLTTTMLEGTDEEEALEYARTLLSYLPQNCDKKPPRYLFEDDGTETRAREVASLVPESPKQDYDMVEVIEALVDHGEFLEVQPLFSPSIVVGFACFEGRPVGIVANQPSVDAGTLDVNASEKAARFVQFLDAFGIPIITLVDVPGYRPGSEQERAGIIRRGAKLITAYATATVPMITVIIRKAFGGAYIVMGSKSLGADMNFSWPASQIAVMGSEGAVDIVFRRQLAAAGKEGRNVAEQRAHYQEMYERQSMNPNLSLKNGELDALIEPSMTREYICRSLAVLHLKDRTVTTPRVHDNAPM